jgi:putative ABC transport system permease protein
MFRNYLKIAFRNLWKHKAFSFINIMGLTVGLTACFLIFLYVKFELSYDSFNTKADRIQRVFADIKTPTEVLKAGGPAWAVAPNIKSEFPEVEAFVRVSGANMLVRKGDIKFKEENSVYADSAFFEVFDFKLLAGNRQTALCAPLSIVLSESTAKKYFGDANPMDQTLLLSAEGLPARVTGLMKDMPENSQLKADMLISMSTLTKRFNPGLDEQWGNYGSSAWLLVKPGTNVAALQAKFPAFLEKRNGAEMKQNQMYATLLLQPLKDVYLHSTRNGLGSGNSGNITNVYIFSIIAIFILLIACINFINLTTARSAERAKEVGIRKVVGAGKSQLTSQFIGESVILCLIAFVLTIGLAVLLLPIFNKLAGKTVSEGVFSNVQYLITLLLTAIGIGLLAGIYPALVLSSFRPVVVLKGRFSTSGRGIFLRKTLVVAQFSISIALIISTTIVYRQMNFMRNQDLGFSKDQVLIMDTGGDAAKEALKQSLTAIPAIRSASLSSSVPGTGNPGAYSEIENNKGDLQIANLDLYFVDYDYIKQFDMQVVAGRGFSREFGTDSTQAMVVNETTVKMFGYSSPQQAIGRRFKQWGREGKIIGVIKDFHFRSLRQDIKPLTMRIEPDGNNLLSAKITVDKLPATLAAIEAKWKTILPNRPFSYQFLDELFDRQYRTEERFGKLFFNFAVLAIFISCLGLLGLAAYSTMQRTKEIGIRKVMGASVSGIVSLLSKDFLLLVVISFFVATPVTWYFMNQWVEGFAYRTPVSWWIFAAAGIAALLIALGTISFQAIKAAVMNPVKSLRSE